MNVEQKVRELIQAQAVHKRKGTVMGRESWEDVFEHASEEFEEFDQALEQEDKAYQLEELGDILGIFTHMVIKAGFTMQQVEARELLKLDERFEIPGK